MLCYVCRLTVLLNTYDVVKEAFLKRGEDFSDRALPGFDTFLDYRSGNDFYFKFKSIRNIQISQNKFSVQGIVRN